MDYYDRQGHPITLQEWARLNRDERFHRTNYYRVADTWVGDVRVSTVWLGLDHSFGQGPPLIFETMIFGGPHDQDQWRYTTEVQALAGHDQAVALARSGGTPA